MSGVLDDDKPAPSPESDHVTPPDPSSSASAGAAVAPATREAGNGAKGAVAAKASPDVAADPSPGAPAATPGVRAATGPSPVVLPRPRRRRLRRTWPQRLLVAFNVLVALACLGTAFGLYYGYDNIAGQIKRVVITRESDSELALGTLRDSNGVPVVVNESAIGEVTAENFLIVGTDGRTCTSDNPQYSGGFAEGGGSNTDTIMLLRVDPDAKQAAFLSFPRDLWVQRPDSNASTKINALYDPAQPVVLADAIRSNFGVPVDHFISLDFCGFRDLVDAIGGIRVPFAYPALDRQTGLDIPEPGCWAFDGEAALAYTRSRHYLWQDEEGDWQDDGTGDYGRVARQQDFVRRVLRRAIDQGARDPRRLQSLLSVALQHVTIDAELTPQALYDLGRAFQDVDPAAVRSFTIAGQDAFKGTASVQLFDLADDVNQNIVKVFSGQALLAPDVVPDEAEGEVPAEAAPQDTVPPVSPETTAAGPADPGATTPAGEATAPPGAVPEVAVSSTNIRNATSIVPPDDPSCT